MKKTLLAIAAIALFHGTASALSFSWYANSVAFDGTSLKNSSDVTGYLIYLGTGATLGSSFTLAEDTTAASLGSSVGTVVSEKSKPNAMGKLSGNYVFDYGTKDNGDVFAMMLVYTGASDGKTYYNISSDTYTLSGIADATSTLSNPTFGFSYSKAEPSSTISTGGGWTAVPEPSTAALALAGLALLLKRRKA